MSLMRLAYASEATFESQPVAKGVQPQVARILMTSRQNNAKHQIMGGLYYGNNRFFQYLEGEEQAVTELYQRIQKDDRHRNIVTLIEEPLDKSTFSAWSMKYVPLSSDVRQFLESHRLDSFNPASFTAKQCEEMIDLIRKSSADQRLVNHDEAMNRVQTNRPQVYTPGLRLGLIVAAVGLLGALVYAGSLL